MESRKLAIAILFLHSVLASGLLEFRPPGGANTELVDADDSNRKGFSLELVHCDSVDSPLYPGNLTSVERMQRDTRLSESRRLWIESVSTTVATAGPQDLNIRPILSKSATATYTVKVVIGAVEAHLVVDTGSSLVWVQSEPCNTCFEHDGPNYKPTQSRSYRAVPPTDPICKPPLFQRSGQQCTYDIKYGFERRYTRGALAFEKFSFESKNDPRSLATVDDIIFGASKDNSGDMFGTNRKLVGMLGMGTAEVSFPMQMYRRDPRQLGRFSYCLAPENGGASGHLRFGTDVVMQGAYQSTPLLQTAATSWYYLTLLDISINGEALHLPPDTFRRNPNSWRSAAGVIIDSGSPKTYFIQRAYDAITDALTNYFRRLRLTRVPAPDGQRLCYIMPDGNFDAFPDMDFHFEGGATLRPDRKQVFYTAAARDGQHYFCLFMAPTTFITIIGARVQHNIHLVYDVLGKQLHFAPKDCRTV